MSDFGTMVATIIAESHLPAETTAIQRHIVAALKHLRHRRFYFSEKSDTMATVADQLEYDRTEYPADLLEIDSLRVEWGSGELILEPISFHEMRRRKAGSTGSRNSPETYCFYGDKLILDPTPGGIWTLNIDYFFDATRDTASGDEIDGSDDTHTNDFFTRGEELLRARAMYTLAMSRAEDAELALTMKALFDDALRSLQAESAARMIGGSFEVEPCY